MEPDDPPVAGAPADLLLLHGTVLTQDAAGRTLEDGAVAVGGGRILELGASDALLRRHPAAPRIDCRGRAVLPGLIDSYTHAGHGLIRGLFDPVAGWPAGELYWHATDLAWWRAEARLAALERTRFGVTTAAVIVGATPPRADEPDYALEVARANEAAGLRALVGVGPPDPICPHLPTPWTATRIDAAGSRRRAFGYEEALEASLEAIRRIGDGSFELVRGCLAPPYLLGRHVPHRRLRHPLPTPADAAGIGERASAMRTWAERLGVPIHTHAFRGSVAYALRHLGRDLVAAVLGPDVVIAHANGLAPAEVDALGGAGCGVAVVPTTHENLWYGPAPATELSARGAAVAVATDGAAPYCSLDLWRELSRVSWSEWRRLGRQDALPPDRVLAMATSEAARALGLADEIGSLEPGKRADIIAVDLRAPHLTPRTSLPHLLVHYASGHDVDLVIVEGRILRRGSEHVRLDPDAVIAEAEDAAAAAFARSGIDPRAFAAP